MNIKTWPYCFSTSVDGTAILIQYIHYAKTRDVHEANMPGNS